MAFCLQGGDVLETTPALATSSGQPDSSIKLRALNKPHAARARLSPSCCFIVISTLLEFPARQTLDKYRIQNVRIESNLKPQPK